MSVFILKTININNLQQIHNKVYAISHYKIITLSSNI